MAGWMQHACRNELSQAIISLKCCRCLLMPVRIMPSSMQAFQFPLRCPVIFERLQMHPYERHSSATHFVKWYRWWTTNEPTSLVSIIFDRILLHLTRSLYTLAKNYEKHMQADLHSLQAQMIPYTNKFKIKNPHPDSMSHDANTNASERRDFAFDGDWVFRACAHEEILDWGVRAFEV